MRCCSRSTTWRGDALAALALVLCAGAPAAALDEAIVRAAIVSAVERQVGTSAQVELRDLQLSGVSGLQGSVFASLPAEARAGQPVRIVLKVMKPGGQAARFGEATCVVDVALPASRTRRAVARGETLDAADVEQVMVDAAGWPLRSVPTDVVGARVVVDLPEGQVIRAQMVVLAPVVRSGEPVTITVRSGGLEVQTRGVAAQAGRLGDVIRVVNPDSGRRMSARVVGPASVEVQHGS